MLLERAGQIFSSIHSKFEWRIKAKKGRRTFSTSVRLGETFVRCLIMFNMWYYFKDNVSVVWHSKLPSNTHKISPNIDHSMSRLMINTYIESMAHTNRLSLSVLNQILIDQVIVSEVLSRVPSVPLSLSDCRHIVICPLDGKHLCRVCLSSSPGCH